MMKHLRRIHFTGIGGAGMCGIAEVLLGQGYQVSGSDQLSNASTERLSSMGAQIWQGHSASHIEGSEVLVISSAIKPNNPEVLAARKAGIPVVPRVTMLAELMRSKTGIAVAGTHGKTTTTSLIASILAEGGQDPTFVIGGRLLAMGSHAHLGKGEFIVAEADESDKSFLHLLPIMAVITNIDADHMDTYQQDMRQLEQAYLDFIDRLPFYGHIVLCQDDPGVKAILPRVARRIISYGLSEQSAIYASELKASEKYMQFVVCRPQSKPLPIQLNLLGMHNVQNALAAIAVATQLDVADDAIQTALRDFKGVGRRLQNRGKLTSSRGCEVTVIDDYGHHPAEIFASVSALRGAYPKQRIGLIFQPHRYTRTRDCFEDFVTVLSTVDYLLITEVYTAGEEPIANADGYSLSRAIRAQGKAQVILVPEWQEIPSALETVIRSEDILLIMGAGSIGQLPAMLENQWKVSS